MKHTYLCSSFLKYVINVKGLLIAYTIAFTSDHTQHLPAAISNAFEASKLLSVGLWP